MFSNKKINATYTNTPVGMTVARHVTAKELEQVSGGLRVSTQKLTGAGGSNGGHVEYTIDGTA